MSIFKFSLHVNKKVFAVLICFLISIFTTVSQASSGTDNGSSSLAVAKRLADEKKAGLGAWLGFPVRVLVMERQTQSPFIAMVNQGQCLIILNTKPQSWAAWESFRKLSGLSSLESYHFALLHEVGHCANKLKPEFAEKVLPEGSSSELYADVFALLAARKTLDEIMAKRMMAGIVQARLAQSGYFFGSTTHNTGTKLHTIQLSLGDYSESSEWQLAEPSQLARSLVDETRFN